MPERLLIVDDEPDFAKFVNRIAVELGHQTRMTTNAADFMAAYDAFDPTLIVLDIIMPDMDGIELIGWLAERQCRARIIAVTGFAPDYAHLAAVLGSFAGLAAITSLKKPVAVDDLKAALMTGVGTGSV